MGAKRRLTAAAVERRLWEALRSPAVRLKVGPLTSCARYKAEVEQPGNVITSMLMTVDIHRDGLISAVIHELLHPALDAELQPWGKLEEVVVLAVEEYIYGRIERNPAKVERWRAAIQAKLGE